MDNFIDKLDWDTMFFGYGVGKTNISTEIYSKISCIKYEMKYKGIKLLYHMQDPNSIIDNYELQRQGFYITDNKVTLSSKIYNQSIAIDKNIKDIKEYSFDIKELYDISEQISVVSRYAYDTNIDKEKVEELYKLWIYNGLNEGFCDKTFIYNVNGKIAGFVMLKLDKIHKIGDISLIGVDKRFRNNGIASNLIIAVKEYLSQLGYFDLLVSTQFRNAKALNLYIKNGFRIHDCKTVYHYWNNI